MGTDSRRYPIWMSKEEAEYLMGILKTTVNPLAQSISAKTSSVLNLKIK